MTTTLPGPKRPLKIARRAIDVDPAKLVEIGYAGQHPGLPVVIRPRIPGVDLVEWIREHPGDIDDALHRHGGILFRGFDTCGQEGFSRILDACDWTLMDYVESATPRLKLGDRVYTSTEFPPEYPIAQHNELSYVKNWPMRLALFCVTAPAEGGESPVADARKVLEHVGPEIRERFEKRGGWRLVRNYGFGYGPGWRDAFHVEERGAAEAYFRAADIEFEWLPDDRLRTTHVRPVTRRHPVTGEEVWFNHIAFWHTSSLPREIREHFLRDFGVEGCPYNTFYGDGTPIEEEVAQALRTAYDRATVAFPWQPGDLVMVDNMLATHGRNAFKGARRVLVAMGNPVFNELEGTA